MTDTKYFEDMWLALDNDLKEFNSYKNDFMSFDNNYNNDSQDNIQQQQQQQTNLDPQTYEQLLEVQNSPTPSREQYHSDDIQERIQAVRQYYNQNPGTFSWASLTKLKKVADDLYKKGLVKQGNQIVKIIKTNI